MYLVEFFAHKHVLLGNVAIDFDAVGVILLFQFMQLLLLGLFGASQFLNVSLHLTLT